MDLSDFWEWKDGREKAVPTIPDLSNRLIDALLQPVIPFPSHLTTNHEPEQTMQTTQNAAPSAPELPPVGSIWTIKDKLRDAFWKGEVTGAGASGVGLVTEKNEPVIIELADWATRPKSQCLTAKQARKLERKQAKVAAKAPAPSKPGLIRRLVVGGLSKAALIAVGAFFSAPIKTLTALGWAYLAAQVMSK